MKYLKILGLGLLVATAAVACDTSSKDESDSGDGDGDGDAGGSSPADEGQDTDEVVVKGERGTSCESTNDCVEGLSCIVTSNCPVGVACANKSCQPSNFEIMGTGKQCAIVECATQADCCGDLPQEEPAKCSGREAICNQPTLPDCVVTLCASDAECGTGTCGGSCSSDGFDCLTSTDCAADECVAGFCSLSGGTCADSAECLTTQSCSTAICDCTNPVYDPLDPICTDEDCEGLCGWTCEEEQCVVDDACDQDTDCDFATPFCAAGECVECQTSDDCEDEECVGGRCGPECEVDSQCSLFEACEAQECVYVGCQSDRECVLGLGGLGASSDQRLSFCEIEDGIGSCVFPCEIDAQCGATQVCLEGSCEYIGCESDLECKTITGLHDQPLPTDERPWVTTAVCRDEEAAAL